MNRKDLQAGPSQLFLGSGHPGSITLRQPTINDILFFYLALWLNTWSYVLYLFGPLELVVGPSLDKRSLLFFFFFFF